MAEKKDTEKGKSRHTARERSSSAIWHKPLAYPVDAGRECADIVDDDDILALPLDEECVHIAEDAPPASSAPDDVLVNDVSPWRACQSRKRDRPVSAPKPLHLFFAMKPGGASAAPSNSKEAAARVSEASERAAASVRELATESAKKGLCSAPVDFDAWEASPIATVHVNSPAVEDVGDEPWGGGEKRGRWNWAIRFGRLSVWREEGWRFRLRIL